MELNHQLFFLYKYLQKNITVDIMETNEDIDLIVNHPNKAINNLSVPIFLTNLFLLMNNFTDGIWVAGLGADAIATVGFISPIFLIILWFCKWPWNRFQQYYFKTYWSQKI